IWKQLPHQSELLRPQSKEKCPDARDVSARSAETGDKPLLHRIARGHKQDRNRRCCGFCRERWRCPAASGNDTNATAYQVRRQLRQNIVSSVSPTKFDRDVVPFDIAAFTQTLTKGSEYGRIGLGRSRAQIADHRQRRLLRARRQWPRRRSAAEQRDEVAPSHSITSSASATNLSGT